MKTINKAFSQIFLLLIVHAVFIVGCKTSYSGGIRILTQKEQLDQIRHKAKQGDDVAQFQMGVLYSTGQLGVVKDKKLAFSWMLKAANQGLPDAQGALGQFYATGVGVKLNHQEAAKWVSRSADQGNQLARLMMVGYLLNGRGVHNDDAKAFQLAQKTAIEGYAPAYSYLGMLYEHGRGVDRDPDAALKEYETAFSGLRRMYNNLPGNPLPGFLLSIHYWHGRGTNQNLDKAERLLRKNAETGNVTLKAILAFFLVEEGRDQNEAEELIDEAINGNPHLSELLAIRAYIHHYGDRHKEAISDLDKVFREEWVIPDSLHELHGDCLSALGNNLAARAAWGKALKAPAEIFQPSRKESIRKKLMD